MAYPKKGLRKITVHDRRYLWSAKGTDWDISLHVMADADDGQVLSAPFPYLQDRTDFEDGSAMLDNQFVITPYTVREVILYALDHGWKPLERGAPLHIPDIEDKIDLRLGQNKEHAIKERIEQGVAPQSATRAESDSAGKDKPQPESEARSR
ncbi:MAG: hypothetical protein AAGD22_15645 [Verrucomicrobiota bacterium]